MNSRRFSRRSFLRNARWSPMLYLPSPLNVASLNFLFPPSIAPTSHLGSFADSRLSPRYPSRSPLDDVLRLIPPGSDGYVYEKHALEISKLLNRCSANLKSSPPALETLTEFLHPSIEFNSLSTFDKKTYAHVDGLDLQERQFRPGKIIGRTLFLAEWKSYLSSFSAIHTAEFQITRLTTSALTPVTVETEIRFALVGINSNRSPEERIGTWNVEWKQDSTGAWFATQWNFLTETSGTAAIPIFSDVSSQSLGRIDSYREQLLFGVDHWRTVIDSASGIDVYGNNGIAAGDFDNDGFDDLYICQPAGLPNRLYRNLGDGTFEDVTEKSGLGLLDATACAIFADFENKGLHDLLIVCAAGPLLFLNQGNGKFALKPDAFQFANPPQGTFTHAAVADYDHDGRLDIYFCLYSYYLGLDQYHYPSPYFDARNGPPNFLFHNEGGAKFVDHTEAAGLSAENDRFSFACAWGDANSNGWPDLYVANDFGRSNLYRNRGNGTFEAISESAGVNVPGAGMSACWADFDNSGHQDIYVSNMWSAAGQRVSEQKIFHPEDSPETLGIYRRHARGNSLYKNLGADKFKNVSSQSGSEFGRWAWSSDSWDFDHDGHSDLYITNGYISGPDTLDAESFFWRHVVGNSPPTSTPSISYERGWNAINEWIRSDGTWSGYERNVLYRNNRNGTFSEISGISGLDFLDDSRAFALADLDHDGRLEVILKNRNAPQIRVLHNSMTNIGDAVCFRLRGTKSNRDAIGASVTIQCGDLRQTKYLQAGSGFLSQHSKELFFGLGKSDSPVSATVRWPNGLTQSFENLPINHRISVIESEPNFTPTKFTPPAAVYSKIMPPAKPAISPITVESWLLDPLPAPDFSLPDLTGKLQTLRDLRGKPTLIHFWSQASHSCAAELKLLSSFQSELSASGIQLLCINGDDPQSTTDLRTFLASQNISVPTLLATAELSGVYNILYRYLFDRRRDLPLPCSFLLDKTGLIVKVYQGEVSPQHFIDDAASIPRSDSERIRKALPFPGTLHNGSFQRNAFTYGIALFQRGFLDQAAASFKQVVAAKPNDPEAYYNLGTLYLRKNDLPEARHYLEQTVRLRPDYPEAWNNLGMIAVQQNQPDEAIRNFQKSLALRPTYTTALLNLGNTYRRQGRLSDAFELLSKAVALEPENPEANYSLGMLFARQNDFARATELLQNAARLRPDYADAWNNLGVLFVRQSRNPDAERSFKTSIEVAPNSDQAYLNLAQLYMISNEKEKARAVLQSLLRLQPRHKLAQQALEMLN